MILIEDVGGCYFEFLFKEIFFLVNDKLLFRIVGFIWLGYILEVKGFF